MIPQIKEINFGPGTANSYATLHQATVSLQEMGERTITTQVRIDGDVVPNFDGWALEFKGEKFILPVKEPQAMKDNSTRNSLIDLTFVSWPVEELKRYFFFNTVTTAAGTIMPDQYKVPVNLNLAGFVALFNNVLNYYFHGKITISLSPYATYATEPSLFEIDYTYLWDVLCKLFEVYDNRWYIEYNSANDRYVIKVGYAAEAITDHDFEYGYKGGLLKFERQVQDADITNILLGRGGEKNLPYRYFKKTDPENQEWAADPDAIPELANIYFDRLHDINFRWYIRGWMHNPNRDTSGDAAWDPGHVFPTYTIDESSPHYWAYMKGLTDESFDPVEYVKDDESIAKYGEHWGALDDNDDVYPTIQGVERPGLGRIDETVAISEIVTDDIEAMAEAAAVESNIGGAKFVTKDINANSYVNETFIGEPFTIPAGKTANLSLTGEDAPYFAFVSHGTAAETALVNVDSATAVLHVVNESTGVETPFGSGIPAGTYHYKITLTARNRNAALKQVTFGFNGVKMVLSDVNENAWKPTFDIWVKNLWATSKNPNETAQEYAERVWRPILGDRLGNEAKVVFSTGFMSISEDYEFVIAAIPEFDQSKTIYSSDGNTYQSEWKLTLYKSSAEYDATGLYIPNAQATGKPIAGDKFYFLGIDMPHQYVLDAESVLNGADYSPVMHKAASLSESADIAPTWLITLDKVRVHTLEDEDYGTTLAERLATGAKVNITDPRFTPGEVLTLYVQSITYIWNEPTKDSPYMVPDIEVLLSDKVVAREGIVSQIQSDINIVKSTYAKAADIETVVRRVATPLFLKKTGEADSSESPTEFGSRVSSKAFRQGDIGGQGWGAYQDGNGKSVYEVDKLVVREEMRVNSLVANQITYIGGLRIESAANIECTQVVDDGSGYQCFFDQKRGSVGNHFRVGDIAFGQVFDENNIVVKYYKRKVIATGDNYITLAKYDEPWIVIIDEEEGITETRHTVDGSGVPAAKDVIVQFGSITEADRQYVIITDVIGGGYQRMLRDLNHAAAPGLEYYFAGRQASTGDRWFVGDKGANKYAEWMNGELTISGRLAVTSQVADGNGSYIGLTAYLNSLQNQIDGNIQSWASGQAPSAQTEPLPKINDQGQVDPSTANYPASGWTNDTTREKHVGDIYVDDSTGQGYRYTKRSNNGVTEYYWVRITDEELSQALADIAQLQDDVAGLDYLVEATNQGTLINGGLVLTSLIQLGQTVSDTFRVWSGINGIINSQLQNPLKSIAAWFGGEMLGKADWDAMTEQQKAQHTYAKSLFRMDGSGYLAGGSIYWNESGYGGIPGITWSNESGTDVVTIGGNVKLASVSGDTVTELVNAVRSISDWFEEVNLGSEQSPAWALRLKKKIVGDSQSPRSFITYGDQIVNNGTPGGGGGGGVEYLYELEDVSLDNLSSGQMLRWNGSSWINVDVPSGFITSIVLAEGAYNGTMRLVINGVAQEDVSVKGYGSDLAIVSDALQSLQAQIDSVASRNNFDEITASTIFSDIVSAGTFIGELEGNAATASLLVGSSYGVGSSGLPVYFSGGIPVACSGASIFPSVASTAEANLSLTIAGQARTIEDLYATFDDSGENIANSFGVVSDALRSLQAQIDSVASRDSFDEVIAFAIFADQLSAADAHASRYYLTDSIYFWAESVNGVMCVRLNAPFITEGDQIVISGTPGGGGQGVGYLYELEDVSDDLATPTTGMVLYYDGMEWIGVAATEIGGVTSVVGAAGDVTVTQIADALTGAGYKLTDTITTFLPWSAITEKPTTLSGYGITDAATASSVTALTTRVGTLESDEAIISLALQSLQSQVDSVSARNEFDELTVTVLFADTLSATSAYIGSITGHLSGNADTASYLVGSSYGVGSANQGVYFSGGLPVACTYAQYASLYNGTAGRLAYYAGANLVSDYYNTIGGSYQPMYLNAGVPTACTYALNAGLLASSTAGRLAYYSGTNAVSEYYGNIGSGVIPMYLNAGVPTASTSTVGSASLPVYLNAGTITACTAASLFSALGSNTVNNLEVTVAGQLRTITNLYATYDGAGENISDKFTIVSSAIQSLQSQIDSVAARFGTDECIATTAYFDMLSVGAYIYAGELVTTGDQTVASDATLKKNWRRLNYGIEDIARATAGVFDWKDGHGTSAGTIAQEWKALIPELVHGEEGGMSLAYGQAAMLNTILLARHETEQDKEIRELKEALGRANEKIEGLEKEVERLRS